MEEENYMGGAPRFPKPKRTKLEKIVFFSMLSIAVVVAFGLLSVYALSGRNLEAGEGSQTIPNTNNVGTTANNGEVQEVTLSFNSKGYVVTPNTLQKGVPVRMTVDLITVTGCMRDIVIKDFGVKKYVTAKDNIIEFTPNKEGTFLIACSMNMGRGYFSVTSDGSATADLQATLQAQTDSIPAGGFTCGGGMGGGCGGCGR
jgi:uncharacterized protein